MDAFANFAYSTVAVPPSPAGAGTTLWVATGTGSRYPAPPFNIVVCPGDALPLTSNAEIARVTGRTGDQFTIVRAQEGSSARSILVGDQIFAGVTKKLLDDLVAGAAGVTAHAPTHSSGGTDPVTVTALAGYPGGTSNYLRADGTFAAPATGVPAAHHATHEPGGGDPLAVDAVAATGSLRTLGPGAQQAAAGTDARLTNARTPTVHATTHEPGGSDPLTVDAVAATGSLRTLGTGAQQAAAGTDSRLTNARTPTAHAATHSNAAGDPVTITNLAGFPGTTTTFLRGDSTFSTLPAAPARIGTITLIIDGGASAITTGFKGVLEVPFACTITAVTLLADVSGSIVIDIWKDSYASYPPTVADTITASAKPTISATTKSQNTTLTGWTTAVAAGDILGFNVDSAATIKRVTLSLKVSA